MGPNGKLLADWHPGSFSGRLMLSGLINMMRLMLHHFFAYLIVPISSAELQQRLLREIAV